MLKAQRCVLHSWELFGLFSIMISDSAHLFSNISIISMLY